MNTFAGHYKCFSISRSFHSNKHLLEIDIPDCTKPPISATRDTRVLFANAFSTRQNYDTFANGVYRSGSDACGIRAAETRSGSLDVCTKIKDGRFHSRPGNFLAFPAKCLHALAALRDELLCPHNKYRYEPRYDRRPVTIAIEIKNSIPVSLVGHNADRYVCVCDR